MFEGNVYFVPFEVMFTLLTCLVMFFFLLSLYKSCLLGNG